MDISKQLEDLASRLESIESAVKTRGGSVVYHTNKVRNDLTSLIKKHDYIGYRQIESLLKITKLIPNFTAIPPLRGWAISPDVALHLYNYVIEHKPKVILEFGSGASTFIFSEAIKKNGFGKVISVDHTEKYSRECFESLDKVGLSSNVEFIIAPLTEWAGHHLDNENQSYWYNSLEINIQDSIDLVFIDGPPGIQCKYSRYPAMEFIFPYLNSDFKILLDDSDRVDEQEIIDNWVDKFDLECEQLKYEKGLAIFNQK